jgi:hypothetical protein
MGVQGALAPSRRESIELVEEAVELRDRQYVFVPEVAEFPD